MAGIDLFCPISCERTKSDSSRVCDSAAIRSGHVQDIALIRVFLPVRRAGTAQGGGKTRENHAPACAMATPAPHDVKKAALRLLHSVLSGFAPFRVLLSP